MQHSDAPWNALRRARAAANKIKENEDPEAQAESWQDFLVQIERVWNKAHAHYSKSPKWSGWRSPVERLRKRDPLLSYLRHARNADEHTAEPVLRTTPPGIGIRQAVGSVMNLEHMSMVNGQLVIKTDVPIAIDPISAESNPIPVTDSSVLYGLPTTHLGQEIEPRFIPMAELALAFYEDALTRAEAFFVK